MDTKKIEKLLEAFDHLDEEIRESLQKPLLHLREKDWQILIPNLEEDCITTLDGLIAAETKLHDLRNKAVRTRDALTRIYQILEETQSRSVPSTLSESIAAIVDDYFAQGADVILGTDVHNQLVERGVVLRVKNPAAVIASILARDDRLEKVGMGKFRKKISKDSEEQRMTKA